MAHNNNVNELFFTGQGDPRHKCVAIGYHNNAPVVYKFDTVDLPQSTRTTVTFNEHIEVAFLDWAVGVHLGSVLRDTDRIPMADFVSHGTTNTARQFRSSTDGNELFEWRRLGNRQPYAYELMSLSSETTARIATYDPTPREVPKVGRAYAYLKYTFQEEPLLRDALVALCLNRWIDWRGM
ncbi:hypothetical protein OH76DRAFT_118499 [Lentinus brumalis]|uniref:Uncharacterized protein n=1 Tax=Lentinus brumalis TaxID=2498619 RepID=A0A371DJH2_9APHY|nr:hypothetical protein OH76DRAFT_118499 [Polyporus brumalis]